MGESYMELTLFLWVRNKGIIISPFSISPVLLWFFFFCAGSFYLCSHSVEWVPRALLCYAGREDVRLPVSYCIVKCPSWWKWPGQRGHKPTSKQTHRGQSPTLTACHLPSLLSLLYWHRDENKSMRVPEGHGTGGEGHLPATFNITTHCSHILSPKIICRSSFDVWAGIAAGKIFIPSRMQSGRLYSLAFKFAFYLHFDIYAPQGMNPNIYHSPWPIRVYYCIVSKFGKKNKTTFSEIAN